MSPVFSALLPSSLVFALWISLLCLTSEARKSPVEGLAEMARKGPLCRNTHSRVPTRGVRDLGFEGCRALKSGCEQAGLC